MASGHDSQIQCRRPAASAGAAPSADRSVKRSLALSFGIVAVATVSAWLVLLLKVAPQYPAMLGLGVLAYTFGLRHAFDADHIAAIDNTVRKIMQVDRRKPISTGLFFSLGHSTVVALLALGFAMTAQAVQAAIPSLQRDGGIIGTVVSAVFLYLIGVLNLAVLTGVIDVFRRMRGRAHDAAEIDQLLDKRGLMTRLLGSRWDLVRREWQMYPVGFLFGLGFDTASEIALLAISAAAAAKHLPILTVMILPWLFAAGMTLFDTADGAFMATAYAWAFSSPLRKVYYNLTITSLSVFVALAIGTVEFAQVLATQFKLGGRFWHMVQGLSFEYIGFGIVGMFVLTWVVSYALWIWRVERRWSTPAPAVR